MVPTETIDTLLKDGPVWVELLDSLQVCIYDKAPDHFVAKLFLCNPKSKTYKIKFNYIDKVLEEYLWD